MNRSIKNKNTQIKIGSYRAGSMNVELVADPAIEGGHFDCSPSSGGPPKITVGFHRNSWEDVVGIMLHEVFELILTQKDLRFSHSGKVNFDSADYVFHFDHSNFGRVCSEAASFLTEALPKLANAYRKYKGK